MIVFLTQTATTREQPTDAPATPKTPQTPDDRATEFKAVEGGTEQHDGATLMVEAYAVLWVILMGWIFLVWRKQAGLHARLDDLEKVLDQAAAKAGK